jgi:hypothetical protein
MTSQQISHCFSTSSNVSSVRPKVISIFMQRSRSLAALSLAAAASTFTCCGLAGWLAGCQGIIKPGIGTAVDPLSHAAKRPCYKWQFRRLYIKVINFLPLPFFSGSTRSAHFWRARVGGHGARDEDRREEEVQSGREEAPVEAVLRKQKRRKRIIHSRHLDSIHNCPVGRHIRAGGGGTCDFVG